MCCINWGITENKSNSAAMLAAYEAVLRAQQWFALNANANMAMRSQRQCQQADV